MNPKEKAQQLVNKFKVTKHQTLMTFMAKDYALMCAEEIFNGITDNENNIFSKEDYENMEHTSDSNWIYEKTTAYWNEVKKELESL